MKYNKLLAVGLSTAFIVGVTPSVASAQDIGWVGSDTIVLAQKERPKQVGSDGIDGAVDGDTKVIPHDSKPKAPHVDVPEDKQVSFKDLPKIKTYTPPPVEEGDGSDSGDNEDGSADMGGEDGSGSSMSQDDADDGADEALGGETDVESIQEKVDSNVSDEGKDYITALDWFAAQQDGAGYFWGGPKGEPGQSGDCSGFMGQLVAIAYGKDPWTRLFATSNQKQVLEEIGLEIRPAQAEVKLGEFATGWYNGGAGGGHTAGTLPSGVNVESGGSSSAVSGTGGSINMYGRNAKPGNDAQFYEGVAVIPWSHFEDEKDKLKFGEISWDNADWRCVGSGAENADMAEEKEKGNC